MNVGVKLSSDTDSKSKKETSHTLLSTRARAQLVKTRLELMHSLRSMVKGFVDGLMRDYKFYWLF